MMTTIRQEINHFIESGTPMHDILVNVDDDRWGDSHAVTRSEALELLAEWAADGEPADLSIDDLQPAQEWLDEHATEA